MQNDDMHMTTFPICLFPFPSYRPMPKSVQNCRAQPTKNPLCSGGRGHRLVPHMQYPHHATLPQIIGYYSLETNSHEVCRTTILLFFDFVQYWNTPILGCFNNLLLAPQQYNFNQTCFSFRSVHWNEHKNNNSNHMQISKHFQFGLIRSKIEF